MKFTFSGLTLDTTHQYEFGLAKTSATSIEKWFEITVYTETSATIDLSTTTKEFRDIINTVEVP